MAVYVGDEEVWKCPKHPSKRRRSGICPACLRDRLGSLCPNCHTARPCSCSCSAESSSSSSSSSSSNIVDGEPSFRRSRSVAVPFFRSRHGEETPGSSSARTPSFLSMLKRSKTKRAELPPKPKSEQTVTVNDEENFESNDRIEDYVRMVSRSRSVNVGASSAMASGLFRRRDDAAASPARGKFWHFPSPMKVFRSSKTPKVVIQA